MNIEDQNKTLRFCPNCYTCYNVNEKFYPTPYHADEVCEDCEKALHSMYVKQQLGINGLIDRYGVKLAITLFLLGIGLTIYAYSTY